MKSDVHKMAVIEELLFKVDILKKKMEAWTITKSRRFYVLAMIMGYK